MGVFDLIFSQVRIPGLGGTELMQELKRKGSVIPVLFIPAYGETESYIDLMNRGAVDYLNKPVKKRDILRIIKRPLNVRASSPGISSSQSL